ncbi:unnamed protein product [Cochlearia groenlandica]
MENTRLRRELAESNARFATVTDLFSIIAMDSPNLAEEMRRRGLAPAQPPVIPPGQANLAAQELNRDLGIDDFQIDP